MKTLLATVAFLTLLAASPQKQTFTGVITDTMCGADHKPMNVSQESKCVRDCVRMDKKFKPTFPL
jgi:hypothetical protein